RPLGRRAREHLHACCGCGDDHRYEGEGEGQDQGVAALATLVIPPPRRRSLRAEAPPALDAGPATLLELTGAGARAGILSADEGVEVRLVDVARSAGVVHLGVGARR